MVALAANVSAGDTQLHADAPLASVPSYIKIDDELIQVTGQSSAPDGATVLALPGADGARASHLAGATVQPVLDAFTPDDSSPFATGGAASPVTIYQASVTLIDAQIKALPTTPVEIVAAPGGGMALIPIQAVVQSSLAEAYVGVASGCAIDTITPFDLISTFSAPLESSQVQILLALDTSNDLDKVEDLALHILSFDGSDYTGGDPANTLKVTVWYGIFEV